MAPSVDSSRHEARAKRAVTQTAPDAVEADNESEGAVDVAAAVNESMHSSYGNAIVQAALSGADIGPLGDVVAGEIAAAAAGMGAMSPDGSALAAAGNAALANIAQTAQSTDSAMSQARALSELRGGSGGQELPSGVRMRMEAAFGRSFANVRVHTGERTSAAADALNAQAVALGSHIHFAQGHYAPGTAAGEAVIAHELTHVVQAEEGRLPSTGGISDPMMAAEREAYGNESLASTVSASSIDTGISPGALALPSLSLGSWGLGSMGVGADVGMGASMGASMVSADAGMAGAMASAPSAAPASAPAMLRENPADIAAKKHTDREASIQHELEMGLDVGFERAVDVSNGPMASNIPKEGTGRREGVFHGPSKSGHHAVNEYMDTMKDIGPDGNSTRSPSDDHIQAPAMHTFSENDGHAHLDGSPKLGAQPEGSKRKTPLAPPSPSSEKKGPFDPAINSALKDAFGGGVDKLQAKMGDASNEAIGALAHTKGNEMSFGKGIDPNNARDGKAMEVVGEEVAHALASGGSGKTPLDQPGDEGERSAKDAGKKFAEFARRGGDAPKLGPAAGGKAEIHRATDPAAKDDAAAERERQAAEARKAEQARQAQQAEQARQAQQAQQADSGVQPGEKKADVALEGGQTPAVTDDKGQTPGTVADQGQTPGTVADQGQTPRTPAQLAEDRLAKMKADEALAKENGNADFRHDLNTIADAAGDFKKALESMGPEEREAFMKGPGKELADKVAAGLKDRTGLDKDGKATYQSAVDGLVGGAETLGKNGVGAVTEGLMKGGDGNALVDDKNFADALNASIRGGNGGLLAASATAQLQGDVRKNGLLYSGTRGQIVAETHQAFSEMTGDFRRAREERTKHEQKFAPVMKAIQVGRQSDIPDQEQLQKDVDAFRERHEDVRAKENAAAEKFASTLAGQDLLADQPSTMPMGKRFEGKLPDETVAMASKLGETDAGRNAVAGALRDAGRGGTGWLDKVGSQAKGDLAKDFKQSVQNGALQGMIDRGIREDPKSAAEILKGAGQVLGGDPGNKALSDRLGEVAKALQEGKKPEELKAELDGKTGTAEDRMLNRLLSGFDKGTDFAANARTTLKGGDTPPALDKIGGGIKALGGLEKVLAGDGGKDLITGGADIAGGVSKMLGKTPVGDMLGKLSTGADTLFAGIDFAEGIITGDRDKAVTGGLKLGTAALLATKAGKAAAGPIGIASTLVEIGYNQWAENRKQSEIDDEMKKTLGPSVRMGLEKKAGISDPGRLDQATDLMLRRDTLRSNGVNGTQRHDGASTNLEKLGLMAGQQGRTDLDLVKDMAASPHAFRDSRFDDSQVRLLTQFQESKAADPDSPQVAAQARAFNKMNQIGEQHDRWDMEQARAWSEAWREEQLAREQGP
ncbi:MAG: DUF4157 domain-containing protein [Myxococcota bacterium]